MFQDGSGVLWADEKMVTNKAEVIEMSYIMKGLMCLLSGKPWGVFGGF